MTLPDRIERTLQLSHPLERVWAALTTADGLGTWFGNTAEVDLRVGGQAKLTWESGDKATLTIERVEPLHVFAYTWPIYGLPESDPRRTYVEFTLEPSGAGTTLTVVESGFSQLTDADDHKKAHEGNTEGWASEPARDPRRARGRRPSHRDRPGRAVADHPPGHRQAPRPAGRGGAGGRRGGGATPGSLPGGLRADEGGSAIPGRAGPGLGRSAGGIARTTEMRSHGKPARGGVARAVGRRP
jgi:uncharacterized protein YndB with AHSA1/START domain